MVPKLTQKGKELLLKALSGETINFTKMKLGNGIPQGAADATELNNPLISLDFTSCTVGTEYVTLTATFNNQQITDGFHVTEIGFFAEDPDNENTDILYAIGSEPQGSADYIPSNDNRIIEMQFEGLIFIGNAENVTAAINSSLVYATQQELRSHTTDTINPHHVTKEQIGLGNVSNLETNDLAPTYTDSETLANIQSGEKLSTVFSKIKTVIASFISHINNRNNPHNITAAQVGAAANTHTHSAADINSGTLSPMRGGTGLTSLKELATRMSERIIVRQMYIGTGTTTNTLTFYNTQQFPHFVIIQPQSPPYDNGRLYPGLMFIGSSWISGTVGGGIGEREVPANAADPSSVNFNYRYKSSESVCIDISGAGAGYVQNLKDVEYYVVAFF